uniref:Uncharacterized protein n=1 Tax=Rhizophora mucronata TaxID=61149 RepID=A0A2P2MIM0_RHIMU
MLAFSIFHHDEVIHHKLCRETHHFLSVGSEVLVRIVLNKYTLLSCLLYIYGWVR